jgi:hypothetical protein
MFESAISRKIVVDFLERLRYSTFMKLKMTRQEVTENLIEGFINFWDTDLSGVDLSRLNLYAANLSGADLSGADLSGANLSGANLSGADLSGANLSGANLSGANLRETIFTGTVLTNTILDPNAKLPKLSKKEIEEAWLEIQGDRVYGWRTKYSQYIGNTRYTVEGSPYVAPVFSVDTETSCNPGIYLASKEWLVENYGKCPSLVRCYCLRSELLHAGDKWRCKRLWVVEET